MSKMMVKRDGLWTPMANLKGDTGPLPADNSVTNDALVTDGAKTNTAYLMGNRLTATAEGELISVDDSYPSAALNLTVDGKSTQLTTTGKNLFNGAGTDNYGYYNGSTGAYVNSTGYKHWRISVKEGDVVRYSGTSPGLGCLFYQGEYVRSFQGSPFTVPTGVDEVTNNFGGGGWNNGIVTLNNADLTYEPYSGGAASPRPDWPQEIESMAGSVVTIAKKNLARPTATESSKTAHGVTSSWDGEVLRVSGTADVINVDFVAVGIDRAPILFAGETYTFSLQGTFSIDYARTTFYFYTSKPGEMNETLHWLYGSTGKQNSWTYTPQEDAVLKSFTLRVGGDSAGFTVNIAARFQLELGSAATYYEPYSGVAATIDLSETPLRSLPDGTKDELNLTYLRPSTRKCWAWYSRELVQRVRLMTLNGSEIWGKDRFGFYHRMDNLATAAGDYSKSLLCDCLAAYRQYPELAGKAGMSGYRLSATGANWLYINVEGIDTIADFRAWLAERVPTILHETTDQPITTQLGPIELPIMQAGTTNIWTDPSTSLSVTYERDRNIVISKLEVAAADLATS